VNKKTTTIVVLIAAFLLLVILASTFPYILDRQGNGTWSRPGILTTTPTKMLVIETPWWTAMPTAPGLGVMPISTSTPTP